MLFRGSPYRYLVRLRISMEIGDLVMLLAWARHHVPTAHQSTWNAGISQYSLPCPPNPPASQHSTKKKKEAARCTRVTIPPKTQNIR